MQLHTQRQPSDATRTEARTVWAGAQRAAFAGRDRRVGLWSAFGPVRPRETSAPRLCRKCWPPLETRWRVRPRRDVVGHWLCGWWVVSQWSVERIWARGRLEAWAAASEGGTRAGGARESRRSQSLEFEGGGGALARDSLVWSFGKGKTAIFHVSPWGRRRTGGRQLSRV